MKSFDDAISEVNERIANSATADLKYIYENSEWYSARYMAGQAISLDKELISKLPYWVASLKESFSAVKTEYRYEETFESVDMTPQDGMGWKYEDVGYATVSVWKDVPYEIPDEQKRQNATNDIIELYRVAKTQLFDLAKDPQIRAFLTEIYNRSSGQTELTIGVGIDKSGGIYATAERQQLMTIGVEIDQLGDRIKLSAVGRTELTTIGMEIGKTLGLPPLTVHLKIRILPDLKVRILPALMVRILPVFKWAGLLTLLGLIGYGLYSLWRYLE